MRCLNDNREACLTEGEQDQTEKQTESKNKIVDLSPDISIIPLNVNDLNRPIKRQRLSRFFFLDSIICCQQESHFKYNDKGKFKKYI